MQNSSKSGKRGPKPELDGLPAYQKIQKVIRHRIEIGELKPGSAVDSERALARIHRVSPMTARHALAELELEGLVERRQGAGTFVAPPKIQFNKLTSFTEETSSRGMAARSTLLSCTALESEPEIAARLELPSTHPLIMVKRLRHAGEEPFAIETCYFSAEHFADVARAPLERISIFALLEREHGLRLSYADEEIDATNADGASAELLGVPRSAALLRIRQVIYATPRTAILYVLGLYRGDRHTLRIRRFR